MGEWVDLAGVFTNYEKVNTRDYSLCVQDAQIITRSEYVRRCALNSLKAGSTTEYDNILSALCLMLVIKNNGSESGGFYIYDTALVLEREIRAMGYRTLLW